MFAEGGDAEFPNVLVDFVELLGGELGGSGEAFPGLFEAVEGVVELGGRSAFDFGQRGGCGGEFVAEEGDVAARLDGHAGCLGGPEVFM